MRDIRNQLVVLGLDDALKTGGIYLESKYQYRISPSGQKGWKKPTTRTKQMEFKSITGAYMSKVDRFMNTSELDKGLMLKAAMILEPNLPQPLHPDHLTVAFDDVKRDFLFTLEPPFGRFTTVTTKKYDFYHLEEVREVMDCPLERLPLYINTKYAPIVRHRLQEGV